MSDQMAVLRSMMRQARQRAANENDLSEDRNAADLFTLAVASGKGGVGKTLCAAHLAAGLARRGIHTLLVEGDLRMPNLHLLFDRAAKRNMLDGPSLPPPALSEIIDENNELSSYLFSPLANLEVLAPAAMSLDEQGDGEAYFRRVLSFARSAADDQSTPHDFMKAAPEARCLIIDAGSGMPPDHLPLYAAVDAVLLLTTWEIASITDAYIFVKLLHSAGIEAEIGLVPSMVSSRREASELQEKFNMMVEKFLRRRVASPGHLPLDEILPAAAAGGKLLWEVAPASPYSTAMNKLVGNVSERIAALTGARLHVAG